ncbi:universal stress protein [Streptomyces sp. NRRL F-5123]|uniref:universal stress protein n=1 Tax=Streptomyces sp. NRRL F-5123 TaxID=1463856 RepID=UPI0004E1F78B|nr:universal stress protein [Streptomyces sp. NRRL F-5123]
MAKPLTVGVDGSDASLRALDWAVDEAARLELPLRILHASLWDRYVRPAPRLAAVRPGQPAADEAVVDAARERATRLGPGVPLTVQDVPDDPFGALLRAAPEAYALVVGNRGRGELTDVLLGSVGLTVAGRAPCPVVVVRGRDANVAGRFGRVTLGVGGPDDAADAVRFAFRTARARGARVEAVHAWRSPDGDAGGGRAGAERVVDDALRDARREHPGVAVHASTAEAKARTPLLAASASSDLLVVGARRRDGAVGLHLGPVNHALLHHADCPVAVVPQSG